MSDYEIRWITPQLAVGHAPMSYEHLKDIREQGIRAIVNLCGEYCDLHEIEEDYGFDVFYLPIPDEDAPDMRTLEQALDWLDEAIYLGKKVLVHCRFGIGRTGTFVTSYLLRRGFALKAAQKKMKTVRSGPTSFRQWRLLRKLRKKEKPLTIREPSLEGKHVLNLAPYFQEYEALAAEAEHTLETAFASGNPPQPCGKAHARCCGRLLLLQFVEAAYLSHYLIREIPRQRRLETVEKALAFRPGASHLEAGPGGPPYLCPLNHDGTCLVFQRRPIACRLYPLSADTPLPSGEQGSSPPRDGHPLPLTLEEINAALREMSQELFFALNGTFLEGRSLLFPLPDVVSGRFIQDYFKILMEVESSRNSAGKSSVS